ncbi:CaiB/BaiF CoA transferase family protein [Chloroflexota bacterium]
MKIAGILEGLKVISMEHMEAIPAASVWFADWGADVIKIEPPAGDMFRMTKRAHGTPAFVEIGGRDINWAFWLLNRNKKSMALNLKTDSGRDIIYKLIKDADIFLSNFQFDALDNLKLDYDSLCKVNPRIIHAVLSGYGSIGPDKDEPGFDNTAAWSRSALMYLTGEEGKPPPIQRGGMMDRTAAPHVVAGVLAALYNREKTGKGQKLEVSLFHSAVWTNGKDIQGAIVDRPMPRSDRTKADSPIWNSYRTKDDRWFQLGMLQSDRYWPNFYRAINRPDFEKDPKYVDMEARRTNCVELIRIIDEIMATRTMAEWEKIFKETGCMYGRVQTPQEVITDPQALANDFYADIEFPEGKMKTINTPVKFYQNPASVRTAPPELAQDNEVILLEMGYTWEDIARLKDEGAIL